MGIFCLLSEFFGFKAEFEYWEKCFYCKAWACTLSRITMKKQRIDAKMPLLSTCCCKHKSHTHLTLNVAAAGSVDIP